ncbi:MAG: hypothetical protein ACE5IC_10595 [Candidatus Brocadiales bacterium]
MGRSYPIFLIGILILFFVVCTRIPVFGKEIYESPKSEKKVKTAMQTLQDGLDDLEDALLQDNVDLAVKLAHEIAGACHFVCNIDVTRSTLSKGEQKEFERLRKNMHYRIDGMTLAADEGLTSVVLGESYKVREACDTCHQVFRKKKK